MVRGEHHRLPPERNQEQDEKKKERKKERDSESKR